jgi:hypothetical protein
LDACPGLPKREGHTLSRISQIGMKNAPHGTA